MKTRYILSLCLPALLVACNSGPDAAVDGTSDAPVDLQAPAGTYALDPNHASLVWTIPHLGLSDYTVRFVTFDGQVTLNPENLEQSSVTLSIDPASVRTEFPGDWEATHPGVPFPSFDAQIAQDEGMLNAADGAPITFTSTQVNQTGPRTADVTGDLNFRGQTRPVTMKATFNGELESHPFARVPAIGFNAEGSFKPSEFGVNLLGGVLGDEVTVRFSGEFILNADAAQQ